MINKGNRSIPLFKSHKSIEREKNTGYQLKQRETHQLSGENNGITERLKCNNKPKTQRKNAHGNTKKRTMKLMV